MPEKCQKPRARDRDAADGGSAGTDRSRPSLMPKALGMSGARGPLDAGAAFRSVHQPIVDEMFKAARAEGRHEPYEAYAFDAFMELVRRARDADREDGPDEEIRRLLPARSPDRSRPRPGISGSSGRITWHCAADRSRVTRSVRSPASDPFQSRSPGNCSATRS